MLPTNSNLSGSHPLPSISNGENANALATSQRPSQSTISREKPRTLDDLPEHRQILFSSQNEAAQKLGKALQDLHERFAGGPFDHEEFLAQCHEIREVAEMLTDESLVVNDEVRERLARLDLHNIPSRVVALTEEEYVAICDDLSVQTDDERGIQATHHPMTTNQQAAEAEAEAEAEEEPLEAFEELMQIFIGFLYFGTANEL